MPSKIPILLHFWQLQKFPNLKRSYLKTSIMAHEYFFHYNLHFIEQNFKRDKHCTLAPVNGAYEFSNTTNLSYISHDASEMEANTRVFWLSLRRLQGKGTRTWSSIKVHYGICTYICLPQVRTCTKEIVMKSLETFLIQYVYWKSSHDMTQDIIFLRKLSFT